MSLRLIGRRPVQYVLEGYAKPGDTYITFPDAKNIQPTPNDYQVRPGVGLWLATLTASDPKAPILLAAQNDVEVSGTGSVSVACYIADPTYWVLCRSEGTVKQETRYVLTLTKTTPPCVIAFWRVWGWRCGANENRRTRQRRGGTFRAGKHAGVGRVAKTHSPLARHRNIQHGNDRRVAPTGALQGGAYRWAGAPLARHGRGRQLRNPVLRGGRDAARILRPEPGNPPIHHPARLTTVGGEGRGA
nr:MAG TPA: hypothetical protein [Caudoviricetes sp.]